MNFPPLRCLALFAVALPLSAQTVSNVFVFKGTIYQQTSALAAPDAPPLLENPQPHAPGPYYIDIVVSGPDAGSLSAPSFKGPNDSGYNTLLAQNGDPTRWDFKAGYNTAAGGRTSLDGNYPNGVYSVLIPGFNGGTAINLSLTAPNNYPTAIPKVTNLASSWSGGVLLIDPTVSTTLTFTPFSQWGTDSGLVYRERLAFVPPSGNSFGPLSLSAFSGNEPFDDFEITAGMLTAGTTYRVVLEYDIFPTYIDSVSGAQAGAIYSNQTQFFITAIPEPAVSALLAGAAILAGAVCVRRKRMPASSGR